MRSVPLYQSRGLVNHNQRDTLICVMHGDGNVYGGYYSSKRGGIDTWSNNPLLSIGSLRRGKNSLRQRAVFYRNK